MNLTTTNCIEEWKPVYKNDNTWIELFGESELTEYEISSLGRLRKGNEIIQPVLDLGNYYYIKINDLSRSIHRLVAEAFLWNTVRKKSRRENVHHINENKQDNRASNLMFCSKAQHKQIHGKQLAERMIEKIQKQLQSPNIWQTTRAALLEKLPYYKEMLEESNQKLERLNAFN